MNVLIWNSRGTGAPSFPALIRDLKAHYRLDFLAILETRCSKEASRRRAQALGFHNMELIDCEGYSGGIWCFWEHSITSVLVIERHRQFMHLQVTGASGCSWILTVVYASPVCASRRMLWDNLSRLATLTQGPWLLGGDFNGTLLHCERRSSATFRTSIDRDFIRWIEQQNMTDIGFAGPEFTWKRGSSEARLDRILANDQWTSMYPNASVKHLPFFKSDHRPLLLCLDKTMSVQSPNRPFRFIAAWVLHAQFDDFVRQTWMSDMDWVLNTSQFTSACSKWNKEVFRHTEGRKKLLLRRLDGINKVVARVGLLPKYESLQLELWKELEDVLLQESLIWAQKARTEWSILGDRNTRYFHSRANQRRKSQRIEAIKDGNGAWVYDTSLIKNLATGFFSNLLSEDVPSRPFISCNMSYPCVDEDKLRLCNRNISDMEVKEALFSMGALKSPGPDGLSALFYQNQWNTVGASTVSYVKFLFANPQAIKEVNGTLVVLIPKKDHPETMGDLRPISLCNVIYKALSKVLVNRLKPILPLAIAPNQCSFVPGRHSSDNIIVAQEVIHTMRCMRQKKGFLAIKIDLEKAYDRVHWKFLHRCLQELNLPSHFIEVVEQCISSSSLQLLWNGDKATTFNPSRGVRQGDPLSPYLFVICMEKLAHLIQSEIQAKQWKPIRLSRTGPQISHLFFADDIILFAEASIEQVQVINKCLKTFCDSSGLKVNQQKTRVCFSNNVSHTRRSEMCEYLGFSITSDLGKYLGVPLHHKRVTKESFHYVVDKVKTRLSNWKTRLLSSAGRATLISSVTTAIPGYVMQTTLLPISTCESLDRSNRQFLWGNTEEQKRIPLVAWDVTCKPKTSGGLGLRNSSYYNQAFLMKIGWQLATRREDLWVKVLRNKYKCGSDILPRIEGSRPGSNLWSGIKRTWSKVQQGIELMPNKNLRWKWTKSGEFTVKSAYDSLRPTEVHPDKLWSTIWKIKAPERCRIFMWLVLHNRLLTNVSRCKRGISTDGRCQICQVDEESLLHVLRDCPISHDLWRQIVPSQFWHTFSSLDFNRWVRWNLTSSGILRHSDEWQQIFTITCWWLWRRRNLFVFEDTQISNTTVMTSVMSLRKCLNEARDRWCLVDRKKTTLGTSGNCWTAPLAGWVKINTDGAFSPSTPGVASGGILRNEHGQFLQAFLFRGEEGDCLTAELWGCLHGLKLAWDRGYRNVILEVDSADAVELIRNSISDTHEDRYLVEEIQALVHRDWTVETKLISRRGNIVADHLAKLSLSSFPGFHLISIPDMELARLLERDKG
ncbi:hypothetical protein QN277_000163 [Acacia crassicarpa]|uniref:Uncharacterized protein n=1 Tax=Acacia crassicarpa TaxID=499986 RepID=A0AAE1N5K1_9FABA|nr:hypothetical protein QN277_000163 [Acacia crassicarpa]